jgi:hypothetical protein
MTSISDDVFEGLRMALGAPPLPEPAAVQQQENALHSDDEHANTTCGVEHSPDSPATPMPRRPATAKPAGGMFSSSSRKRSRAGGQRRVLGMPLAPVAVAGALGLPLLLLHVIRRCAAREHSDS